MKATEPSVGTYRVIIVKTHYEKRPPSKIPIRVRPLAGQGFPTYLNVHFSKKLRSDLPLGTLFKVQVTLVTPQWRQRYLTACGEPTVVTRDEAAAFIRERYRPPPKPSD